MTIKASSYPTNRPTLDLNFAQTKRLDPRVTFTRSSTGSYFDANGVLQSAATNTARFDHNPATGESLGLLVEEARTNSLTYSQPDVSGWTATEITYQTDAGLAPDGTWTAALLVPSATNTSGHYLTKSTTNAANTWTMSVYAKAAGYNYVQLNMLAQPSGLFIVDLSNGTVASTGPAVSNVVVTSVANGWYRIAGTVTTSTSRTFTIYPMNTGVWNTSFSGNGTSGIYVWGAQLEAGSFPTSYIPTPATFTSRASSATYYDASGVIQTAGTNVARSAAFFPDSNGVMRSAGLLLEAAGTNLLTYSEQFDNAAWTKVVSTITQNAATAPDGTLTADRWQGDAGSAFVHNSGSSVSGTHTISMWVKAVTPGTNDQFRLVISGAVISQNFTATSAWQRFSFTGSAVTSNNAHGVARNSLSQATDLYIWGAQLEASPYPTSYIPTTTATVTRSADVSSSATVTRSADVASITGTNFSSWYNQSEGTLFADVSKPQNVTQDTAIFSVDDGSSNNQIRISQFSSGNYMTVRVGGVNSLDANIGALTQGVSYKNTLAYKAGSIAAVLNAGSPTTSSGAVPSTLTTARIGLYTGGAGTANSTIRRLTYWPTRLSNATLQAITL